MGEMERVVVVNSGLLKLQRPVRNKDGFVVGYDPDTHGIEEINLNAELDSMQIHITFDDGEEWIFERTN